MSWASSASTWRGGSVDSNDKETSSPPRSGRYRVKVLEPVEDLKSQLNKSANKSAGQKIPKQDPPRKSIDSVASKDRTSPKLASDEAQITAVAEGLSELKVNAPKFSPKSPAKSPVSQTRADTATPVQSPMARPEAKSNSAPDPKAHGFPTIHDLPKLAGGPWLANPKTGATGNFFQNKSGMWFMTFETCAGPKKVKLKFRDDLRIQFGRDIVSGIELGTGNIMMSIHWNGDSSKRFKFCWTRSTAAGIREATDRPQVPVQPRHNPYARKFFPRPQDHQFQGNIGAPRSYVDAQGRPMHQNHYHQNHYHQNNSPFDNRQGQPYNLNALNYHDNGYGHPPQPARAQPQNGGEGYYPRQRNYGVQEQVEAQRKLMKNYQSKQSYGFMKHPSAKKKKPVRLADMNLPEDSYAASLMQKKAQYNPSRMNHKKKNGFKERPTGMAEPALIKAPDGTHYIRTDALKTFNGRGRE